MPKYAKEQTAGVAGTVDRPGESLKETIGRLGGRIDTALERFLPSGENYAGPVVEAMRYSLLAPGKRIRPVLTLLCAELCGNKPGGVIEAAAQSGGRAGGDRQGIARAFRRKGLAAAAGGLYLSKKEIELLPKVYFYSNRRLSLMNL